MRVVGVAKGRLLLVHGLVAINLHVRSAEMFSAAADDSKGKEAVGIQIGAAAAAHDVEEFVRVVAHVTKAD